MLRVDFSFDKNLVESNGYTVEHIHEIIKKEFKEKNIECIEDGEMLSFVGGKHKNDFSNMWIIILNLTSSDWFLNFATSCIWREGSYKWEDVLRQAKEKK